VTALIPLTGPVVFTLVGPTGLSMQLGCATGFPLTSTGVIPANTTGIASGTYDQTTLAQQITFPMTANGQLSASTNLPAGLSVLAPLGLAYNPSFGVNFGGGGYTNGLGQSGVPALFCDVAITDLNGGPDGIPGTVPDGNITYQLGQFGFGGSALAVITLNNTSTGSVLCSGGTIPLEGCTGAEVAGAPAPAAAATVNPNPANGVFVALNSGVSFSLFGAGTPSVNLTATYTEDPTLGNLTVTATTPISFIAPGYSMTLYSSAPTVVATGAVGTGTTVTAQLYHFTTGNCVPLTNYPSGISVGGTAVPYLICGTTASLLNVPAATAPSFLVPGAEPGLITFTTTQGYFGTTNGTTTASPGVGQSVTVQCGSIPASAPTILTPEFSLGQAYALSVPDGLCHAARRRQRWHGYGRR
jgi:hypothetical protein